ncbi:hypothetical protein [Haloarchaeobius sp. DT45]|uniref:hypothetical protein n=1 Tax=Haloarchaeobius sp. DT45 TaxID=3446116 RepID=UPI003F6B524C
MPPGSTDGPVEEDIQTVEKRVQAYLAEQNGGTDVQVVVYNTTVSSESATHTEFSSR